MGPAGGQDTTYTQNSHVDSSPRSLHFLVCRHSSSSLLCLRSKRSHGYGSDDGQSNNCVAGAVDLWDFETFADVPPQVADAVVGVVRYRESDAKLGQPDEIRAD